MHTRTWAVGEQRSWKQLVTQVFAIMLVLCVLGPSVAWGNPLSNDSNELVITAATAQIDINACNISIKSSVPYKAAAVKPRPTVTYKDTKLELGVDYKVSYKNNTSIGTATVRIVGKGRFSGRATRRFTISYSNEALAIAACRLSYSRAKKNKIVASTANGYKGTVMYKRYAFRKNRFSCDEITQMAVRAYMGIDMKFPTGVQAQYEYLAKSSKWRRVGRYRAGMELKPGDIYIRPAHTCMYVGKKAAQWTYKRYLKASSAEKKRLGKRCADLGKPTANSVWVSSHHSYFGGSAGHICSVSDALLNSNPNGYIYRYVGANCKDVHDVTS